MEIDEGEGGGLITEIYFKSLVIIKIFDQQGSFESFVKYENPLSSNGM